MRLLVFLVLLVGFAPIGFASARPQERRHGQPASGDQRAQEQQTSEAEELPQEQQVSEEEEPPEKRFRWDDGLWIEAQRFDFRSKIGGGAQLDSAAFVAYPSLEDLVGEVENGVEWRRARVDATGTFGRRWGFRFRWDFAVNDPPNPMRDSLPVMAPAWHPSVPRSRRFHRIAVNPCQHCINKEPTRGVEPRTC